jgi:hypothetical protein
MRITRDKINNIIYLDQEIYIKDILQKYNMANCNGTRIPGEPGKYYNNINNNDELLDEQYPYKSAVGSLLYLSTNTRPDISYYVSQVARFFDKPSKIHWEAVKRILRYLKQTSTYKLKFDGNLPFIIKGYSDASFAQDPSRKSTTGTLITLFFGEVNYKLFLLIQQQKRNI